MPKIKTNAKDVSTEAGNMSMSMTSLEIECMSHAKV